MAHYAKIYWTIQEAEGDLLGLLIDSDQTLLTEEEMMRFNEMKVVKRKTEWLLGRITAKALLTSTGLPFENVPFDNIVIANHPEGAPYLLKTPKKGCLSISHRQYIGVCAFTSRMGTKIGIDLEKIEARAMSFVEDFFTQTEAEYTKDLPEAVRHVWATLVWSAKEAVLKAWQKGLRLDTRNIDIVPIHPDVLQTRPSHWIPIEWKSNIAGYPDCWLGWQRWKNYIITLAATDPDNSKSLSADDIIRVQLENFPTLN
jgi:4'-phosphopantetheinyl transferase